MTTPCSTNGREYDKEFGFYGFVGNLISLIFCLALGCGGENKPVSDNFSSNTNVGTLMTAPKADDSSTKDRIRLKDDPKNLPVLVEMNGTLFQVFEISKVPYVGKKVERYPDGMEKRESMYSEGKLTRVTEFHQSGQKKMEVKVGANGRWERSYWDNNGNTLQKAPIGALGRARNWTFNLNQQSIDIVYRGISAEVILKGFGKPDDKQNGVWIYRAMRVQTADGLKTTVKFLIRNGIVFQVTVEP